MGRHPVAALQLHIDTNSTHYTKQYSVYKRYSVYKFWT